MMKNTEYIPLPHDEQGFLNRIGEEDLEASLAVNHVHKYAYYLMNELCLCINIIDIMRKKELNYMDARDFAILLNNTLPWYNPVKPKFVLELFASIDESTDTMFHNELEPESFVTAIAQSDLTRRDEWIEDFKRRLYDVAKMIDSTNPVTDTFDYYYAYIKYAFDQLWKHWANAKYLFLAPIFATAPCDTEAFGCDSYNIIDTAYIPTEYVTSIYDVKGKKIVDGVYRNGGFEPLSFGDFMHDSFPDFESSELVAVMTAPFENLWGDGAKDGGDVSVDEILSEDLDEEINEYL